MKRSEKRVVLNQECLALSTEPDRGFNANPYTQINQGEDDALAGLFYEKLWPAGSDTAEFSNQRFYRRQLG